MAPELGAARAAAAAQAGRARAGGGGGREQAAEAAGERTPAAASAGGDGGHWEQRQRGRSCRSRSTSRSLRPAELPFAAPDTALRPRPAPSCTAASLRLGRQSHTHRRLPSPPSRTGPAVAVSSSPLPERRLRSDRAESHSLDSPVPSASQDTAQAKDNFGHSGVCLTDVEPGRAGQHTAFQSGQVCGFHSPRMSFTTILDQHLVALLLLLEKGGSLLGKVLLKGIGRAFLLLLLTFSGVATSAPQNSKIPGCSLLFQSNDCYITSVMG
ncbi:uncharacterized protein LOC110257392 [Sus scrofa]|uniref:uncharacterized protein LOC110257392 n=1 Tax=Sus scrofa TaxID=9823 RepID=UPI000A2B7E68|nr:uncharacterized protein LOC110257392 [Sus scrofa]